MAPAVAKILKNAHGIHLPSSTPQDSDVGLASQMIGGCDLQEVFQNLPSGPFPLCIPVELMFSRGTMLPHHHHRQRHTFRLGLSPPGRKSLGGSQRVAPAGFPGGVDMFEIPAGCVQEARPPNGGGRPDGGDVTGFPPSLALPPLPSRHGQVTPILRRLTPQRDAAVAECLSPSSPLQPFSTGLSAARQEAARTRLRRQAALQYRAHKLRSRLQALLGQHASQHCDQQLEGLRRRRRVDGSPCDVPSVALPQHVDPDSGLGSNPNCPFRELAKFSRSSRAVLRGLQEVLDSDATASSSGGSSDEEQAAEERMNRKTVAATQLSRERRWLEERAALGSRWSWLQLRLAELDGRIQQVAELHRHIRSNKGVIVLADSQPLTDTQIQRTLLREMAGLSCTVLDADSEPCSPTRLLHNIERQSAQLNQIVNSLMSPLGFSPPSKQPNTCAADRTAFMSARGADDAFSPRGLKRKRAASRRLTKAESGSLACARTRPLISHCRRRLFALCTRSLQGQQDSGIYVSTSTSSSSSSSSCPCSPSCHPACADLDCSSRGTRRCGSSCSSSPPSSNSSSPQYLKRKAAREEWCLGPPLVSVELFSPAVLITHSSTPLHTSQKLCKQRARHRNSRILGLSPIKTPGFTSRGRSKKINQKKRKRRRLHRFSEAGEEDFLPQLCESDDGSDEVLEHKKATQGLVRKCPGESVYNINNVVIPSSGAKFEKLQYKDIVTPRWRVVGASILMLNQSEAADKEEEVEELEEDVSDEAFARRHLVSERKEKMHRMSWGKRPCCRHPKRSGSRWSGSAGGMCTSGEESAVELIRAQADTDERQSLEEWLAEAPWKQRAFPLTAEDEDALFSDDPQTGPPGKFGSFASVKPNLSSACATLPSGGQSSSRRTPENSRAGSTSV